MPAQILGFYKFIELGLKPDISSANRNITCVAEIFLSTKNKTP